jgi:hypothetical protein
MTTDKTTPTDDDLATLVRPLWLTTKPSPEAQAIRAGLSIAVDGGRWKAWPLDYVPEYVWDLIDIAAQRGLDARR